MDMKKRIETLMAAALANLSYDEMIVALTAIRERVGVEERVQVDNLLTQAEKHRRD